MNKPRGTIVYPDSLDPDVTHLVYAEFDTGTRSVGQYKNSDAASRQAAFYSLQGRNAIVLTVATGEAKEYPGIKLDELSAELGWIPHQTLVHITSAYGEFPAVVVAGGDGWALVRGVSLTMRDGLARTA